MKQSAAPLCYEVAALLPDEYDTTIEGPPDWQAVILHGETRAVISMLADGRVEVELAGPYDGLPMVYFDQDNPSVASEIATAIHEAPRTYARA